MRLIGLVLVIVLSGSADTIRWMGYYDRALAQAKQAHKLLLVLAVKPHCPACRQFMSRLLHDPSLTRRIAQEYISVIVTDDACRNYPKDLYYTLGYPTLFLVDPSDEHFITDPPDECFNTRIEEQLQTPAE